MFMTILKGNLETRQCKVLIRTFRAMKTAASQKETKSTKIDSSRKAGEVED